jgi:dolichyl-phosphate beta-glucosyltransferase
VARLAPTLAAWTCFLDDRGWDGEVVVADGGSTDGTPGLVRRAADADGRIRLEALGADRGKGGAVRHGVLAARGAAVLFADADLGIAPHHLVGAMALLERADVVVARRRLGEYAGQEGLSRVLAGAAVQTTRRALLLAPGVADTQAGFKLFRAPLARRVFGAARVDSFAFDIEALWLARRLGARIAQMPVRAEHREGSTYHPARDLGPLLADCVRIRARALRGAYGPRGRRPPGAPGR